MELLSTASATCASCFFVHAAAGGRHWTHARGPTTPHWALSVAPSASPRAYHRLPTRVRDRRLHELNLLAVQRGEAGPLPVQLLLQPVEVVVREVELPCTRGMLVDVRGGETGYTSGACSGYFCAGSAIAPYSPLPPHCPSTAWRASLIQPYSVGTHPWCRGDRRTTERRRTSAPGQPVCTTRCPRASRHTSPPARPPSPSTSAPAPAEFTASRPPGQRRRRTVLREQLCPPPTAPPPLTTPAPRDWRDVHGPTAPPLLR